MRYILKIIPYTVAIHDEPKSVLYWAVYMFISAVELDILIAVGANLKWSFEEVQSWPLLVVLALFFSPACCCLVALDPLNVSHQ